MASEAKEDVRPCDPGTSESGRMQNSIKEGDFVIFKKENILKAIQIRKNRTMFLEKMKFKLDGAIGHPYGTMFEVCNMKLVKVERKILNTEDATDKGIDNRDLHDRNLENQKLSRDEIVEMKKEGLRGQEIVDQLVENSATFKIKTEFSQEKYIKKKKKKHVSVYTILRPCTRLISDMYTNKGPARILNLRIDSLGQILSQANVRANSRVIVMENTLGLVLGAVLERLSGLGCVVSVYSGTDVHGSRPAVEVFNFTKEQLAILHHYPLHELDTVNTDIADTNPQSINTDTVTIEKKSTDIAMATASDVAMENDSDKTGIESGKDKTNENEIIKDNSKGDTTEKNEAIVAIKNTDTEQGVTKETKEKATNGDNKSKRFRYEKEEHSEKKAEWRNKVEETRKILKAGDFDSLIVASKFHPTPIVMDLIEYVAPSRPIVVFSQYKEPLMDCFSKLRSRGGVLNLRLTETWLREHQVLPGRTHPLINMSATGGYLLTATMVMRD
ncbi:unnamed protein product [Owenia fusiformis]|uniref:tRNA (adenine(58)-N(1))-methyltransferase non-catalytic subunit TRM6 n=1 Tax=Owenia fusiformis TaxID=6347 RepID=A0A8J1U6Z5_OWEFU|nr:unnamed protein product [Owenia fusiformis]